MNRYRIKQIVKRNLRNSIKSNITMAGFLKNLDDFERSLSMSKINEVNGHPELSDTLFLDYVKILNMKKELTLSLQKFIKNLGGKLPY